MDREQEEMQFLGFFGIFKEAFKIIFSWRKIFTQITLALILPLAFILLAYSQFSEILSAKITQHQIAQFQAQLLASHNENLPHFNPYSSIAILLVVAVVYFTLMFIFSLLSISAIVYSVACFYTNRDINFKKVMTIVPKVWKRLMVTFACFFLAFKAYLLVSCVIYGGILVLCFLFIGPDKVGIKLIMGISVVFLVLFSVGSFYMSMIWYLANVVSVLEQVRGISAMTKSRELLRGKMWTVFFASLVPQILEYAVYVLFKSVILHGETLPLVIRFVFGILCLLFLAQLMLFALVVQTIVYFVCKSYHRESIDKSALSDRLEVYHGEYVPLKIKDLELEQSHF